VKCVVPVSADNPLAYNLVLVSLYVASASVLHSAVVGGYVVGVVRSL